MKRIPANLLIRKLLFCPITEHNPLSSLTKVKAKVTFIQRKFDFAFMFFTSCFDPLVNDCIIDFQWVDHDRFVYDETRNESITYSQMQGLDDLERSWMAMAISLRFERLCFSGVDSEVQEQLNIVANKYGITDAHMKIKIYNETPDPS